MKSPELLEACFLLDPNDHDLLDQLQSLHNHDLGKSIHTFHDEAVGLMLVTTGNLIVLTGFSHEIKHDQQLLEAHGVTGPHNPFNIADMETIFQAPSSTQTV